MRRSHRLAHSGGDRGGVTIVTHGATAELIPTILGSSTAGAVGAGAIAGAAGSLASQGFGLATGLQDRFSWKGVALAAIGGGVSGGLDSALGSAGLDKGAMFGSQFVGDVVRGAMANTLNQGVGIVTGLQPKFDWAGLAAASVGSAAMGAAKAELLDYLPATSQGSWLSQIPGSVRAVGQSMAEGIGKAAASSLLNGTSFGDNLLTTLPNALGHTIGSEISKYIDIKQLISPAAATPKGGGSDSGSPPALGSVVDILGKINALPITLVGAAIGFVNAGIGLLRGNDVDIDVKGNAIQFTGGGIGQDTESLIGIRLGGNGAITLRNVELYAGSVTPDSFSKGYGSNQPGYEPFNDIAEILTAVHEQSHTYQYQYLGLAFLPLYLANGFQSNTNPFETAADRGGRGGSPYPDYVFPKIGR